MQKSISEPRFITQRNLLKRLGISIRALNKLRDEGRLPPGVRTGARTVMYTLEGVEAFEQALRKAAGAGA